MGGQRESSGPLPVCRMAPGPRFSTLASSGPLCLPRIPHASDFGCNKVLYPVIQKWALLLNTLQKHGRTLVTKDIGWELLSL